MALIYTKVNPERHHSPPVRRADAPAAAGADPLESATVHPPFVDRAAGFDRMRACVFAC
jgi:hypothetical protein